MATICCGIGSLPGCKPAAAAPCGWRAGACRCRRGGSRGLQRLRSGHQQLLHSPVAMQHEQSGVPAIRRRPCLLQHGVLAKGSIAADAIAVACIAMGGRCRRERDVHAM